jgi:CRP-like cAMP-binding protein
MGEESSFDVLKTYLEARASFTSEELAFIRTKFIPITLRRGEFLQRAGEVARYTGFIAAGCMRKYAIDATGKEHIVTFAPETWWVVDGVSLTSGTPAQFFIDAIEDSNLLLIDPASHEQLVERVPGYAAAYRLGLQRAAAARDRRIVRTLSASARERYLEFLETYPSIAARVPQWMLASYLGVSAETVSRIRKALCQERGRSSAV